MIRLLLPLLILAMDGNSPTTSLGPEAVELATWGFEADNDRNYDGWPDGWVRWRGAGYPNYVDIGIVDVPGTSGVSHCLRIQLDGGAGRIDSGPINARPQFSYLLQAKVLTSRLRHGGARITLSFCDAAGNVLETHASDGPAANEVWTDVAVGPVAPSLADACRAVVGLHLEPGPRGDLRGAALFDSVRLIRMPRMTLRTRQDNNLFFDRNVEIQCVASGFSKPDLPAHFELLDAWGHVLAQGDQAIKPLERADTAAKDQASSDVLSGVACWKPNVPRNGFYQVRATIDGRRASGTLSFAVIERMSRSGPGEFGWSLPRGSQGISTQSWIRLLPEAGVQWLKFPVWFDESDVDRAEGVAKFAERLAAQHIEMVGMLDVPPPSLKKLFGEIDPLPVASVFVEPAIWRPSLDPVLTRLSYVVRWWQLGGDRDTSFVALPGLEGKFAQMRDDLSRFGHDLNLGLPWRTLDQIPETDKPLWSFVCFTSEPPMTPDELRVGLPPTPGQVQPWVCLEPLPEPEYGLQEQCRDLVLRMVAAKQSGVRAIFVPDPFDLQRPLVRDDGSPAPLFVPWRTAAVLLGGARFAGSLPIGEGIANRVFLRGHDAVVVLWSSRPQRVRVQLGENLRRCDMWGEVETPPRSEQGGESGHEIPVGPDPVFLIGASADVVRWNLAIQFEPAALDSVFGTPQTLTCRFTNTLPQGVGGTLTLEAPDLWDIDTRKVRFKLAAGEERQQAFRILLNASANSGWQPVRLHFDFSADREYRFSVIRNVRVGLENLDVNVQSYLDEQGNLVVEQEMNNQMDVPLSFECLLSAPERRRMRQQVFQLKQGRATSTFVVPNGRELIGQTLWLRAEEIDGPRILNYHVVAQE